MAFEYESYSLVVVEPKGEPHMMRFVEEIHNGPVPYTFPRFDEGPVAVYPCNEVIELERVNQPVPIVDEPVRMRLIGCIPSQSFYEVDTRIAYPLGSCVNAYV